VFLVFCCFSFIITKQHISHTKISHVVWNFQHRRSDAAVLQGVCCSGAVDSAAAQRAATAQQRYLQRRRGSGVSGAV
jgi:hypothetical protein